jgi:hypothetical protein
MRNAGIPQYWNDRLHVHSNPDCRSIFCYSALHIRYNRSVVDSLMKIRIMHLKHSNFSFYHGVDANTILAGTRSHKLQGIPEIEKYCFPSVESGLFLTYDL